MAEKWRKILMNYFYAMSPSGREGDVCCDESAVDEIIKSIQQEAVTEKRRFAELPEPKDAVNWENVNIRIFAQGRYQFMRQNPVTGDGEDDVDTEEFSAEGNGDTLNEAIANALMNSAKEGA
jgi:hypothetical protein